MPTTLNRDPSFLRAQHTSSFAASNADTHCSRRSEWFQGPALPPKLTIPAPRKITLKDVMASREGSMRWSRQRSRTRPSSRSLPILGTPVHDYTQVGIAELVTDPQSGGSSGSVVGRHPWESERMYRLAHDQSPCPQTQRPIDEGRIRSRERVGYVRDVQRSCLTKSRRSQTKRQIEAAAGEQRRYGRRMGRTWRMH